VQAPKEVTMPWFKVTSDPKHIGLYAQIQNEFDALFVKAKSPKDAALYSKRISEDEIELYFSPGASRFAIGLIAKYGGFQCEVPSGNVLLVVGRPDRNLMKPEMRNFNIEAEYWYYNRLYGSLSDPVKSASIIKNLFQAFPKKVA
jgi:hypothetical protein